MIKTSALALTLALALGSQAFAADLTPEQIIQRHVDFGAKGDIAGMAGDYAEDGVMLQPGQAVQGRAAIQAAFARIFGPGAPKVTITPIRIWHEGDVGFITWQANGGAIKGQDSFLVRGGKILVQAVFISSPPPPAPQQ